MVDAWDRATTYEPYVGRWSRLAAARFLEWAALPSSPRVLDVGCGTGAVSDAAVAAGARGVVALDASAAYARSARARLEGAHADVLVADGARIPLRDGIVDAAVSGLVLNFLPDPLAMVREMRRVVRAAGVVAAYVWDYGGRMEMMRRFWDAAVAVAPERAAALDEGKRFPLCEPRALAALFRDAGLASVTTAAIDQPTVFSDFDDFWSPFLGGQGPAPGYVDALPDEERATLREHLRATLPTDADGRIRLVARAWAVRGERA